MGGNEKQELVKQKQTTEKMKTFSLKISNKTKVGLIPALKLMVKLLQEKRKSKGNRWLRG